MSFVTIHQHAEWKFIEEWFARRAAEAGVSVYGHSETVNIESAIDPDIAESARQLTFGAGQSLPRQGQNKPY